MRSPIWQRTTSSSFTSKATAGRFADRIGLNPILLLLDLKMPKVNGLEVLRQMKKTPELAGIPVVMLSSSCEALDLKEAWRLGASAYVLKPVRFKDFVDAVKTIWKFWGMLNVLRPGGVDALSDIIAVRNTEAVRESDAAQRIEQPALQ